MKLYRVAIWLAHKDQRFSGSAVYSFTIPAHRPNEAAQTGAIWVREYTDFTTCEMRKFYHKARTVVESAYLSKDVGKACFEERSVFECSIEGDGTFGRFTEIEGA